MDSDVHVPLKLMYGFRPTQSEIQFHVHMAMEAQLDREFYELMDALEYEFFIIRSACRLLIRRRFVGFPGIRIPVVPKPL